MTILRKNTYFTLSLLLVVMMCAKARAQSCNLTGNLQHDRTFHTATTMNAYERCGVRYCPHSTVLIAAGVDNDGQTMNSAELYDADTGLFSYTGNLNHDRKYHDATFIPLWSCVGCPAEFEVLITAGENNDGNTMNTAELYLPNSHSFAYTAGNLQHDRALHTATPIAANPESYPSAVLIAAGIDNDGQTMNVAELYDVKTGTFAYTGNLQHDRKNHTATQLNDGTVLIAGGQDNDGQTMNVAEIYDPTTRTFSYTSGRMVHDRYGHTATLLPDGTVLIAGGFDNDGNTITSAELYYPTTKTFAATGSMVKDRARHTATLITVGQVTGVFIAGGYTGQWGNFVQTTQHTEFYNPTTKRFSAAGDLVQAVAEHTASYLSNGSGSALVAAGRTGNWNFVTKTGTLQTTNHAEICK